MSCQDVIDFIDGIDIGHFKSFYGLLFGIRFVGIVAYSFDASNCLSLAFGLALFLPIGRVHFNVIR